MAFDLNKNGGSKINPSKFDLSKGETENPASKSKNWIIPLLGVLVIGGGIWYYSSLTKTSVPQKNESTKAPSSHSTATPVIQTEAKPSINDTDKMVTQPLVTKMPDKKVNPNFSETDAQIAGSKETERFNRTVPVTFAQGASSFASTNKLLVKRIISYLNENPTVSIYIDGYASSDGPLAVNQSISQARADAFKHYLISLHVNESRIIATGKGIQNPIAPNNSNAGRKKNRRVEIRLL
jgi:outer membrane protein OmpA-like peptidoglycan-associated protein